MQNVIGLFAATGRSVYAKFVPFIIQQLRSAPSLLKSLYDDVFSVGLGFSLPRNAETDEYHTPDIVHEEV